MPSNSNRRYSVPELCEELGLSHFTLQRWRSQGSGPEYEKIGNKIYYPEREFEAWRKSTRRSSTSEALEAPSEGIQSKPGTDDWWNRAESDGSK